jgi:hypothetical protein
MHPTEGGVSRNYVELSRSLKEHETVKILPVRRRRGTEVVTRTPRCREIFSWWGYAARVVL